jgi:HlyD family secretion protein
MPADLKSLRIDRSQKNAEEPSRWAVWWILIGIAVLVLLGAGRFVYGKLTAATEVDVVRVRAESGAAFAGGGGDVILNATGYIIAAHKIQLASKVVGKVSWIGVEKGDRVRAGQVLVRLEDDEYRAQVQQAQGQLLSLNARLAELTNGSRPEEIAKAKADVDQAQADLNNAKVNLDRIRGLVDQGVFAKQQLDDAQARYDAASARVVSSQKTHELVRIGPRREQIDATHGQIEQIKGVLSYYQTQLANTEIKAPVTGTILERNVERGEFVTTGFVGDRGAKGYVVSLADLNDLKVELDINQNDFAKLGPSQKGIVTTDAFPDRRYEGIIDEVSPEANRQKATVQVKVKILKPDEYLRPEMNASVAFIAERKTGAGAAQVSKPLIYVPAAAIKDSSVFVISQGKALRRAIKTGGSNSQGVRVEDGLFGGEDVIINPPADLKEGDRVKAKGQS